MSTCIDCTKKITEIQSFLENNPILGFSKNDIIKLVVKLNRRKTTIEMIKMFSLQCQKKVLSPIEIGSKNQKHLTVEQRINIEILNDSGFGKTHIALFINKDISTVSRELLRNSNKVYDINSSKVPHKDNDRNYKIVYSALDAERKYKIKRTKCIKKCIFDKYPNLRKGVVFLLKIRVQGKVVFSPDVIAAYSKQGSIKDSETTTCSNTIYNAIKRRKYELTSYDLSYAQPYRIKEKFTKSTTKDVSEKKKEISIENMPDDVKNKTSITHFQGDSVVGTKEGSKNTVLTIANTASQFFFAFKSENRTADATVEAYDKFEREVTNLREFMKTILFDNGVEFSSFDKLMKSIYGKKDEKRFQIYFAHAYASYERGCNENKNRMLRRFFPKGTDFSNVSDEKLFEAVVTINNMPRKALGYKTPLEVFEKNLKSLKIDIEFLNIYRVPLPSCLIA